MRATEFITERDGTIGNRKQVATVGLNVFYDNGDQPNSDYVLNRVMMAVASADGSNKPIDMDSKSWVGKQRSAHPYTEIEQRMLKQAFKAAGATYTDLNHGDLKSQELQLVNTTSPMNPFKGYR